MSSASASLVNGFEYRTPPAITILTARRVPARPAGDGPLTRC